MSATATLYRACGAKSNGPGTALEREGFGPWTTLTDARRRLRYYLQAGVLRRRVTVDGLEWFKSKNGTIGWILEVEV